MRNPHYLGSGGFSEIRTSSHSDYSKINLDLLQRVTDCHAALAGFRKQRSRCLRFTYGDQWSDKIMTPSGSMETEYVYMTRQGNLPLKNNLIRRLVRNVLGVYRNRWKIPVCQSPNPLETKALNEMLQRYMESDCLEELYARSMEEFLISGLAVHKKWHGVRNGMRGCHTDMVDPDSFFFDTGACDVRADDVGLLGEVHDVSYDDLYAELLPSPRGDRQLRQIYGVTEGAETQTHCRVYEVWHRCRRVDQIRFGARELRRVKECWAYTFLSPLGHVLAEGESPYMHESHPYVMKAYPFINSEIHSFVSDIIDQQKLTNRLISMYDWILRASSKGVLLFPEDCFPEGVDINDMAEEWSRFNGVIIYRPNPGTPLPQQISSKSADIGITQLLEIQMKMMEDISGVNGALQGKLESNSMSGTLYDQQTRNSLTALADLMKTFDDFTLQATRLDLSNLRQYGATSQSPYRVTLTADPAPTTSTEEAIRNQSENPN